MKNQTYNLIEERKTTVESVIKELESEKTGTNWAEYTNQWAIDYAKELGNTYGDCWYEGLLPKQTLLQVLLPKHEHMYPDDQFIFPLDTLITQSLDFYTKDKSKYAKECMEAIVDLKEKIKANGFNSVVVLAVINDTLKHVDGLHRMLALMLLFEEGYEYEPIRVYLCDNTR